MAASRRGSGRAIKGGGEKLVRRAGVSLSLLRRIVALSLYAALTLAQRGGAYLVPPPTTVAGGWGGPDAENVAHIEDPTSKGLQE